jgi:hypothetical protein
MVTRSMDSKDAFGASIKELRQDLKSIPLMRQAMIAGWNYALVSSAELVAGIWNESLPKHLHVSTDAFVDRGQDIEWLTAEEMKEIVRHRGGTLDPMKEGFDPFYQWKFIRPDPSLVKTEKNREWWKKRAVNKFKGWSDSHNRGYGTGRYQGD